MSKHAPRGPVKMHPIDGVQPIDGALIPNKDGDYVPCRATSRKGARCRRRPIPGGYVCYMHGGAAPQVQASARERLLALQPLAIQTLAKLLARDEFPTVQLGASKDILDRTEGKAAESLHVMGADNGPLRLSIEAPWLKPPS